MQMLAIMAAHSKTVILMASNPLSFFKLQKEIRNQYDATLKSTKALFEESENRRRVLQYNEFRRSADIEERTILYECYWGRGMVDNPLAIFKYLYNHSEFEDYRHVWCVESLEEYRSTIDKYANWNRVSFVEVGSSEYLRVLATAKYLINNVTFPAYFNKRPEQVYVNTWHGTPMKSMGYEAENGNTETANTIRNFLHADYLVSANTIMTDMYLRSYKLAGLLPGTVIEAGYPRNDILHSSNKAAAAAALEAQGVHIDSGKTVILYAPTWRQGTYSKAVANGEELLAIKRFLEHNLGTNEYQVLIKPHQFVYRAVKDNEKYRSAFIPSSIDANELLAAVDILISDYSSIFLDYMVTGRPILFYITDAEHYVEERGLAYSLDELPGPYTDDMNQIVEYVRDINEVKDLYQANYKALGDVICANEDGLATQRVVECVFRNDLEQTRCLVDSHEKKRLLISIGALNENGISHAFISLLRVIDYSEWDVTAYVIVKPHDAEMKRKVDEDIDAHVRVLMRVGFLADTPEEYAMRLVLGSNGFWKTNWMKNYPYHTLENEFNRLFGFAQFDYIIDFCGYSRLDSLMLLQGHAQKKSIWLHNDMLSDMNKVVLGEKPNEDNVGFVTALYPRYDHLVSCSKSVMEVNRANFATNETYCKYTYAKNVFDKVRLEKSLKEETVFTHDGRAFLVTQTEGQSDVVQRITFLELPQQDEISFITIGRFSSEKNHEALIRAFSAFKKQYENARLYIVGVGALFDEMSDLVDELGLVGSVNLTGQLGNPFPLMKRCGCFILPSLHEGQPVVLLEARACGLPIIVANFSTVSDSLFPQGQLLIEPTIEGIYNGMVAFAHGEIPIAPFDIDAYNAEAYQEFIQAIQ